MASREDELRVRFTAIDQATKATDALADKVEKLDGTTADVTLEADDKATADVLSLDQKLDRLEAEDRQVVLRAEVQKAERDVRNALRLIQRATTQTDLEVALEAKDNASQKVRDLRSRLDQVEGEIAEARLDVNAGDALADVDRVQSELRDIDGQTARVNIDSSGIDDIVGKLEGLTGGGGPLTDMAGTLGKGGPIVGGALALGGALFAAGQRAADLAIEAQTTADLTGSSVEEASRLQAVWKNSGADVNDLNDVLLQMNGVLKDNPELATQLGINLNDGKNIAQRFVEVVGALEGSTLGAAEKADLMSQAFGEEGVRQVQRLLTIIGGDLQNAIDEVGEGQVITGDDVEEARRFKQEMTELSTQVSEMATELGQSVVPAISSIVDLLNARPAGGGSLFDMFTNNALFQGINNATGGLRAFQESQKDNIGVTYNHQKSLELAAEAAGELAVNEEAAGERATWFSDAAKRAGKALDDGITKALDEARQGLTEYQDAQKSTDWGTAALAGATEAMAGYRTGMLGMSEFAAELEGSFDNLGAAVHETVDGELKRIPLTLDATTEAGRRQIDAISGVAAVLDTQFADAYAKSGGSLDTFRGKANEIADATLANLQRELGLSAEETELLRGALGLTEGDYEARFKLAGAEEARIRLGLLQGAIEGLPDNVETKVEQQILVGDYEGALKTVQDWYDDAENHARLTTDAEPDERTAGDTRRWYDNWFGRNHTRQPVDADAEPRSATNTRRWFDGFFARAVRQGVNADANTGSAPSTRRWFDGFFRPSIRQGVSADANTGSAGPTRNWFTGFFRPSVRQGVSADANTGSAGGTRSWFANWFGGSSVRLGVNSDANTGSAGGTRSWFQGWFNNNPVVQPVITRAVGGGAGGPRLMAAGGLSGPAGAVAGENYRPEFLNGQLIASPTSVPPNSAVMGENQTQRMFERLTDALEDFNRRSITSERVMYVPAGVTPSEVAALQRRYAQRNGRPV